MASIVPLAELEPVRCKIFALMNINLRLKIFNNYHWRELQECMVQKNDGQMK